MRTKEEILRAGKELCTLDKLNLEINLDIRNALDDLWNEIHVLRKLIETISLTGGFK